MHLVFAFHELPPFRQAFLADLAAAFPQAHLSLLLSLPKGGFDWQLSLPASTQVQRFGTNQSRFTQGRLQSYYAEFTKGGEMIQHLTPPPDAVVIGGYADVAYRRIVAHCWRQGIPCLLWMDSNIRCEQGSLFSRTLKHLILPRLFSKCSGLLICGRLGRAFAIKYGAVAEKIFFCPALPEVDAFSPHQRMAEVTRKKSILFCGRLAREKRLDLLIDAFAQIAPYRPDWDLVIVGDGPLRAELMRRVPPACAARVRWLGAVNDPTSLAPIYLSSSLFVLPSDYEPWGVVVAEAAAAGLPLICSDIVGAAADLLQENVNGRIFASGSMPELARILLEMTARNDLVAMGQQSREILSRFRTMASPIEGLRQALATSETSSQHPDACTAHHPRA